MIRYPDFAAKLAALRPDAIAFRDLQSDRVVTYLQFDLNVARAATLLLDQSVSPGDRVAVLCRNRIEFFELLFACAGIGAVLVPLNWRMPAAELVLMIEDARPVLIFSGKEDIATAWELASEEIELFPLDETGGNTYAAERDRCKPLHPRPERGADEIWYLLYTSGTTGNPKAVIQTFGMAIANYVNIAQAMAIRADDVTLNFLPLYHTAGINLVTLPTFFQGGEALVAPGFDLEQVVELLIGGALDTFFAVPAIYQQISLHPQFDSLDLSQLRSWGCGGAPMPDELTKRFLQRGARICNGMGMTETGPTVFLMDRARVLEKLGSVGKPQLLSSVRLVDEDGCDVEDGVSGELWFSGPGVTPGYFQHPETTAESITADGWLKSGDLAKRDSDGYYTIVGRINDMYISGGENVHPAEIEKVLSAHPNILEAAVVALPDEQWGEIGCAYVSARPSLSVPDDSELITFCRERLAAYKIPKTFVTIDEFPHTAAGKIKKHLL